MRASFLALLALMFMSPLQAEAQGPVNYELKLSLAPHAPGDAPDVVAHVPAGFSAERPLDVVVFLHGFDCCARSLVAAEPTPCRSGERPHKAWDLAGVHDAAHTNTLLLVPQLAFLKRTSQGHRFGAHGAFDRMLDEVLARIFPATPQARALHSVTLVAHSGGYGALVAILRDPHRKAPVRHVVLLDALYAGTDVIASWALEQADARVVSLHTAQAETTRENARLRARLRTGDLAPAHAESLSAAVREHAFVVEQVSTPHANVPARHLADVLRGLPFAERSPASVR
jgi:hypothetical protein